MILAGVLELWNSAWPAGATMLGLGLGFAIILLIASEKLRVEIDGRVEQVNGALPNLNCGGCGFAGCIAYAKAMVEDPGLIGRCAPGGQVSAEKIARILNLQISDMGKPKRPVVHCRASADDKTFYATYRGIQTCTSANAGPNVQQCSFGCLGFGDCVSSCKFDAMGIIDGLATVDYNKCTGCGACARSCPRNLIEMVPFSSDCIMAVACKSRENVKATRQMCRVGCIGCSLCVKRCDMFSIEDNLARLDYDRYALSPQAQGAMDKCPTGVIVFRGRSAPADRRAPSETAAVI